ncbi:hypothetical protein [Dactylosporangium sp. NPDC051484]|uniref:hypothetical protein n=1 Tax=Dactylosporangium sp. NPDC051484 TaxID=3154942 RepID=UPI00344DEFC8
MTSVAERPTGEHRVEAPLRTRRSGVAWAALALVLSWSVPLLTHALRIDWVLPILLLVATASLLRSGRTALDRLVLAAGLLVGATCAAGLLLSVWPWHLEPVPVAGTAFSVLVVAALMLRRRPSLPTAFGLADIFVVGLWLLASVVPLWALRYTAPGWLLGRVAFGDDFSRHYMLFDAIRSLGGYVFLHRTSASSWVPPEHMAYPQGSHFLYALLENFVLSSSQATSTLDTFNHLVLFLIFTQVFLFLTVLWAIRWVAGIWLSGWAALPVLGAAATYLAFGDPMSLVPDAFVSQVPGLAVMVIGVALLARPVRRTREQLVLVGCLVIASSFVYYLFLPLVLISAFAWLIRYRRRLRQHRVALLITIVIAGAFVLVTPLLNMSVNTGAQLLLPGGASIVSRWLVVGIVVVPLAALFLRRVRRLPVWQLAGLQVGSAAAITLTLYGYQSVTIGHSIYYFEKVLLQLALVGLIAGGAPAVAVLSALRSGARPARVSWPRFVVAASATAACVLAALVVVEKPAPGLETNRGAFYLRDQRATPYAGDAVVQTLQHFPDNDGYLNMVFFYPLDGGSPTGWWTRAQQSYATLYIGTIQRNYYQAGWMYGWIHPANNPEMTPETLVRYLADQPEALVRYLAERRIRARIITEQPELIDQYQRLAREYPEAGLVVVDSRSWWQEPTDSRVRSRLW